MIVTLIIVSVVLLLLFWPTHIVFRYVGDRLNLYLRFWLVVKINLLKEKTKTETKPKKSKETSEKKTISIGPISDRIDQLGSVFRIAVGLLDTFCKHFTMYRCKVLIRIAGDDPADVATEFGVVNAAVYGIISYLNEKIKIKKKELCIDYTYIEGSTEFELDFRFRVILLKFLIVLICTNIHDIMQLISSISKPKEIRQEVK